ncbi:hypothetical protein MYX77_01120 [Acidobacteriia bacterium AH_259_A11_L15]|nr:hypothetical protein [Acidobacteriia bacterium AH_259_A11_L15]
MEYFGIAVLALLIFILVSLVGIPASLLPFVYSPTLSFRHVIISLAAFMCSLAIGLAPREPMLLIPVGVFFLMFGQKIITDPFSNGIFGAALLFGIIFAGLVWLFGI